MVRKTVNNYIYKLALIILLTAATSFAQTSVFNLAKGLKGLTPGEYYNLSLEAERLQADGEPVKAAELYSKIVSAYPLDGENWARLGRVRYRAGDFRGAVDALKRGIILGAGFQGDLYTGFTQRAMYSVAAAYAKLGENELALEWLEKTIKEGRFERRPSILEDETFAALRNNPRFKRLGGSIAEPNLSRTKGWETDVDYLLSEIERLNYVYHSRSLPSRLQEAANKLRRRISVLSEAQIAVELQHLLVLLGQTHNTLYFPYAAGMSGKVKFTHLPLSFYIFPEGLYITDAKPPYEDLIGARVLRFDDTPAEKAVEATRYVKDHENDVEILGSGVAFLPIPQVLHALGLIHQPDEVKLTVEDRSGKIRTISPQPAAQQTWQKLEAPRLADLTVAPPLYLRQPNDAFWFEDLADKNALYLAFNQIEDKNEETLAQFAVRLRTTLADNNIKNLIVDVRRNNGGDTYLYAELLRTLIWFDAQPEKRLFVIIGRRTFSATANFITDIDRLTNAVFVGEPSGGKPITLGSDSADVTLPYSGLRAGLSSGTWQLTSPRDSRPFIAADIPVELSAKDYFANRDPIFETILSLLNKENGASD